MNIKIKVKGTCTHCSTQADEHYLIISLLYAEAYT